MSSARMGGKKLKCKTKAKKSLTEKRLLLKEI